MPNALDTLTSAAEEHVARALDDFRAGAKEYGADVMAFSCLVGCAFLAIQDGETPDRFTQRLVLGYPDKVRPILDELQDAVRSKARAFVDRIVPPLDHKDPLGVRPLQRAGLVLAKVADDHGLDVSATACKLYVLERALEARDVPGALTRAALVAYSVALKGHAVLDEEERNAATHEPH